MTNALDGCGKDQLTVDEFTKAVRFAHAGKEICYFKGVALPNHSRLGAAAYHMHELGFVKLYQRRTRFPKDDISLGEFDYIAVKTHHVAFV